MNDERKRVFSSFIVHRSSFIVHRGAGAGWAVRDRAAREHRLTAQIEQLLDDVDRLEEEQKWPEALAAIGRAEAVLAGGEAGDATRQRVADARRDLAFVAELERIRQKGAETALGNLNHAGTARDYARAFREYGVDVEALPAEEAVARLRRKPALAEPVAAALDAWMTARRRLGEGESRWKPLAAVARGVDADPLRDRLRAMADRPVTPELQAELLRLAESIDLGAQRPATIAAVAATLRQAQLADAGVRILQDGQRAHPADFWLNYHLGHELNARKDHAGAARHYSIAVALRPGSCPAWNNLGYSLTTQGKPDEAVAYLKKALEIDPKSSLTHLTLGTALMNQGKLDEAVARFRRAVELDPKSAAAHEGLGMALKARGRLDEAVAEYRTAVQVDPKKAVNCYANLGSVLLQQRKLAGADLNGDGKPDLTTANDGGSDVSVLLGHGDGSFQEARTYATGGNPRSVAVADFNGDGKPDLVTANYLGGNVGVLLGNGDGSFRSAQYSAAGSGADSVAAGDFNGDGRPDVAVADSNAGVSVLLNTGDWRSFQVGGFPSPSTAGEAHTLTVTALDTSGGVMTGYAGTVHFTSTDPQAALPADYTFTAADQGTHTFSVTMKSAGTRSLTVTDTSVADFSDSQAGIAVNPAAVATFEVAGFRSPVSVGEFGDLVVTARDAYGNVATNYAGTVHFSSSDPAAALFPDYTCTASDGGTALFSAALNTVGRQSITVTDAANPNAAGSEVGIVVNPVATITGLGGGLRNQALAFTLGANSGLPAATQFTYAIDWDGDGVVDQTATGPSGTAVTHSYPSGGTYTIRVTATVHLGADDYGSGVTYSNMHIFAETVTTQADPGDPTKSALVVEGTAGADYLALSPGTGNAIVLVDQGYVVGTFSAPGAAAFAHLLVYGYAGDDNIQLTGGLAVPSRTPCATRPALGRQHPAHGRLGGPGSDLRRGR